MILAGTPEDLQRLGIWPMPQLETDIAALVRRELSLDARIARARKQHRTSRHLTRAQRLAKAREVAA